MKESEVENYLVKRIHELGGEVRKLKWINRRGAPDRIVLWHGVYFIELKRPKGKAEAHQKREHIRMRAQGAKVFVLNNLIQVDNFIKNVECKI